MTWWKFFQAVRRGEHKIGGMTWFTAAAALVYTISPIDLIPELIFPLVGLVDDLGLWGVTLMLLNREKNAWEAHAATTARVVDA
ncbi:YkvA family protein [Demequina sp. NBRC 110057]|uniref:YkvA family protein n=1 Tax=Demequina sp. NBRC 110057 TaxID=1570346 RepID=UPI000A03B83C|nr:YkvA family protein [Demequina sp. NBRC 110057]